MLSQLDPLFFGCVGMVVVEIQHIAKTLDAMDRMEDCDCTIDTRAVAESDKARVVPKVLVHFILVQADVGDWEFQHHTELSKGGLQIRTLKKSGPGIVHLWRWSPEFRVVRVGQHSAIG